MKSLTLLLIPLILLSSCTIDWNDNYDQTLTNVCTFASKGSENIYSLKYETCLIFSRSGDTLEAIDITSGFSKSSFKIPPQCYQDSEESGVICNREIETWKEGLKGE